MKKYSNHLCFLWLLSFLGCGTSTKTYDYNLALQTRASNLNSNQIVEIKMRVVKGLSKVELPGSIAMPFVIEGNVTEGQIPSFSDVHKVRIHFLHGWEDLFLTNRSVLTLQITPNGELYGIKEIPEITTNFQTSPLDPKTNDLTLP